MAFVKTKCHSWGRPKQVESIERPKSELNKAARHQAQPATPVQISTNHSLRNADGGVLNRLLVQSLLASNLTENPGQRQIPRVIRSSLEHSLQTGKGEQALSAEPTEYRRSTKH